jgi:hypothetical protein
MPDRVGEASTPPSDDEQLGLVLIATWALRTGRTLRRDVAFDALSAAELIVFWADPLFDDPFSIPYGPATRSGERNLAPSKTLTSIDLECPVMA